MSTTITGTSIDVSLGTIQDQQGNVRTLERTAVANTPYALPSGSSGKYFSVYNNVNSFTIDSGDCEMGQIITVYNHNNTDMTISWTGMVNGVYFAGDTTNQGTNSSVTLAGKGLVTILNDTADRMILSGNVS